MKRLIFALSLIVILSACQPDPRKEADAYATHSQADQDALNAEQARRHQEELNRLEIEKVQRENDIEEAVQAQWTIARQRIITVFGWVAAISMVYIGIAIVATFMIASIGRSIANAQKAFVQASLIYPDPVTGLFPLLRHVHGNRYYLVNGGTEGVVEMGTPNQSNPQMISALQVSQVAGIIARSAERSKDPTGVAMVNPPIVSVSTDEITLGSEIHERIASMREEVRHDE